MAKFTFADGTVFEGTVDELAEYTRLAGGAEAETAQEIEGPVRVGDTIEITDSVNFPTGSRYVVESVDGAGKPGFNDVRLYHSKYRIVARKEETPTPAKPSVKVGDYIVFDEGNSYITAGKAYKVVGIDPYDEPTVVDDEGDEITAGDSAPEEYRIITDARELAFAKAVRKLNEFKKGDIVRVTRGYEDIVRGDIGIVSLPDGTDCPKVLVKGSEWYVFCDLIAPAESRVDGE